MIETVEQLTKTAASRGHSRSGSKSFAKNIPQPKSQTGTPERRQTSYTGNDERSSKAYPGQIVYNRLQNSPPQLTVEHESYSKEVDN